jgi:hypothetical protein
MANLQDQHRVLEKHLLRVIEQIAKGLQQVQQTVQNSQRQAAYAHQAPV